ncbi:MAG: hypothetical protein WBW61_09010, partial [Rhodanobacteraceae bacterium]
SRVRRLHHHIHERDGDIFRFEYLFFRFGRRTGMQQFDPASENGHIPKSEARGLVDIVVVIDDQYFPGMHRISVAPRRVIDDAHQIVGLFIRALHHESSPVDRPF